MERHTKHRVANLFASVLVAASFAAPALAEDAGETVLFETPVVAFEENYPASEAVDMALLLDLPADYFSEITFPPMSDLVVDEPPLMFAQLEDPLETP